MARFEFLKEYVDDEKQNNKVKHNEKRHIFYKVERSDIDNAEIRMGRKFPDELKLFYLEIGYGFLCKEDKTHTNRIMHPSDIADFYCEDEVYSYVDRDLYENNEMIFFDLGGEGDFITFKVGEQGKNSEVYYFGKKIADSLNDFLIKMNLDTNYYMKK